jgi:type II secretory ATPase GspE/PulE/Tfp pilus assembly ATPase PilB-like protein
MYRDRMIPLIAGDDSHPTIYGITLNTPETRLKSINDDAQESGRLVSYELISDSAFRAMMKRYDPPKEVVYDDVDIAHEGASQTIDEVSKTFEQVRSDDVLNYLIEQADQVGASDIHLENQRLNVRIRFRIDGTLHPIANLTHEKYRILFSSIASAANLSIAATEAQSGHIVREIAAHDDVKDHVLNMRIETVPTTYGQDAVIRLFNFDENMLNMDVLGMTASEKKGLQEIIDRPSGMLMIVGPTGSGKSTTLYSVVSALNNTTRKILTLEDPVEYDVPGIVQVPIDTTKGRAFVDELRTVLRLDPDIVMVGEIRDNDTAKTAIQAAITGHLLLATFHADDAAAAFARMVDMIGINPIFANAIRMVIGQRLVRKLDPGSSEQYTADAPTTDWIKGVLKDLPAEGVGMLPEQYRGANGELNLDQITLWKPVATDDNPFGYRGRTILMEQLEVKDNIAAFLRGEATDINANVIRATARENGMVTMLQKGVIKALLGETTIAEVNRVL